MGEEYEILPKDEIDELRHEIEKIKKDPFGEEKKNKTLLDSMDSLTEAINKLLFLFEKTQKELIDSYSQNNPSELLHDVIDQNEKIAKGTLAVADLVKEQKDDIETIKQNFKSKIPEANKLISPAPNPLNSNQLQQTQPQGQLPPQNMQQQSQMQNNPSSQPANSFPKNASGVPLPPPELNSAQLKPLPSEKKPKKHKLF